MCASKPKAPKPPPPPQPIKPPDIEGLKDRMKRARQAGLTGGTMLTSPQGLGSVPTASATLLGA